jgi:phosphate transport system protein
VNHDVKLARQVREAVDELDTMRRDFHARIREALRLEPDNIECLLKLNSVSKHIERLGDMATNVAEDVIYMVEGEIVRHRHEW